MYSFMSQVIAFLLIATTCGRDIDGFLFRELFENQAETV